MIKEELITLPAAILAREVGFDEPCGMVYYSRQDSHDLHHYSWYPGACKSGHQNSETSPVNFSAPSQSLLARWIREVHHVFIRIDIGVYSSNGYNCAAAILAKYGVTIATVNHYSKETPIETMTYEEAMEYALLKALEYIKQQQNG